MTIVNGAGYVERQCGKKKGRSVAHGREWWLIKPSKQVDLGVVQFPPSWIGYKVRFKVEEVKE